jgi:uncharacterized protein (DUF1330 family)
MPSAGTVLTYNLLVQAIVNERGCAFARANRFFRRERHESEVLSCTRNRWLCAWWRGSPRASRSGQAARLRRVEIAVKDKDGYNNNFLKDAQKLIFDHGGKYIAGGYDKTVSLLGAPLPNRVGILQFASMDAVKAWQDGGGRDIQDKVGSKYADFRVFAVEGVESK